MPLIKKNNKSKTTQEIVDDIKYSINKITSQNTPILSITITNTSCRTKEELRFHLTNKLFNKIHKDYKHSLDILNYFFVIEYPTKVSMGNQIPDNCEVHTHIILGTTIPEDTIKDYIYKTFSFKTTREDNVFIENTTLRNDKWKYAGYLIKQSHLLTDDSYNYKALIISNKK